MQAVFARTLKQNAAIDARHEVRVRQCVAADLPSFQGVWNKLLRQSGADSIFMTYEWMQAWLATVCPMARMTIVTVHSSAGEPLGLAPFYRTAFRFMKVVPYRGLRVLGDVGAAAEYPDIMVRRGHDALVAPLLIQTLMQTAPGACIWMTRGSGWSGMRERLRAGAAAAGLYWQERPSHFGAVDLPDNIGAYLNLLSGNQRSMLRRRTKHYHKVARVELERCTEPAQLDSMMATLFRLHQLRWSRDGYPGAPTRLRRLIDFYKHFAPIALANDWLRLYALRLDGVIHAVQLGYLYGGAYHQIQEGFDPAGPEGVGNVLRVMSIESLINEGVRRYDFLCHYTEHKRRWGAELRTGCDLLLGRPTLKNKLLFSKGVWPTGRFLREQHPTGWA